MKQSSNHPRHYKMNQKLELILISFSFLPQFDYTTVYKKKIIITWFLICKYHSSHLISQCYL